MLRYRSFSQLQRDLRALVLELSTSSFNGLFEPTSRPVMANTCNDTYIRDLQVPSS